VGTKGSKHGNPQNAGLASGSQAASAASAKPTAGRPTSAAHFREPSKGETTLRRLPALGSAKVGQKRPFTPAVTVTKLYRVRCARSLRPRYHACGSLNRFATSRLRFTAGFNW